MSLITAWGGDIELLGNTTFEVEEDHTLIISGVISSNGNYGFTKTGLGTLRLSNKNTYTGNTIISEGALELVYEGVDGYGSVDGGSISNSAVVNMQGVSRFDISGINSENSSILGLTGTGTSIINLGSKTLYVTGGTTTRMDYSGVVNPNDSNLIYIAPCFRGSCLISMIDGSKKQIKEIVRGDMVLNDKETNSSKKVCRLVKGLSNKRGVRIGEGLLGNSREIISSLNHPIWIGNNRVYAKDIRGVSVIEIDEILYTIQYEEEGSYYVEDVKVDAISPDHRKFKLPKELYFDNSKYSEKRIMKGEDDPRRNKPLMIKEYVL